MSSKTPIKPHKSQASTSQPTAQRSTSQPSTSKHSSSGHSSSGRPAEGSDAPVAPGSAPPQYDSALKPLLWLLIPFVVVIIYGALN